jgi:hypothetical protein
MSDSDIPLAPDEPSALAALAAVERGAWRRGAMEVIGLPRALKRSSPAHVLVRVVDDSGAGCPTARRPGHLGNAPPPSPCPPATPSTKLRVDTPYGTCVAVHLSTPVRYDMLW